MTANHITIRRAREKDIPKMADLLALLFSIEVDFEIDRQRQLDGLALLLDNPGAILLVAEAGGGVIGMCTGQQTISTAEGGPALLVEDVIVAQSYRGKGVGKLLLEKLSEAAENLGIRRLQLLCDDSNSGALAFYERQGWQRTRLICLRTYSGDQ